MINKQGQIGQIVTSVVIIFVVFFLMLIFVIVSSNIAGVLGLLEKGAGPGEVVADSSQAIGSRVLMELFLSDQVEIDGEKVLVIDALERIYNLGKSNLVGWLDIAEVLEEKFAEDYSCNGENILIFSRLVASPGGFGGAEFSIESYKVFIRYIEAEGDFSDVAQYFSYGKGGINKPYPQTYLGYKDGYYTRKLEGFPNSRITVKENIRC